MTRLEALQALAEKVESGNIPDTGVDRFLDMPTRGGGVYADPNWYDAHGAYWRGSLDAAKALHEAVLPGWGAIIHLSGRVIVFENLITDEYTAFVQTNPARAWLLAILKALIAREQNKGGE